jgi:hypothetical protein
MEMQPYKGYFIDGTARMVHPFDPSWYPAGSVLRSGPRGSIIEVARFELPSFTLELKAVYPGIEGRGGMVRFRAFEAGRGRVFDPLILGRRPWR